MKLTNVMQFNKKSMNKKQKLTQEKKFLLWYYSKKSCTNLTLKVYNAKIKRGVITIENLNPLEKQFYAIFTAKNATERIAKCQEAYDLMQKELNEI